MQQLTDDALIHETKRLLDWIRQGGATSRFLSQEEDSEDKISPIVDKVASLSSEQNFIVSRVKLGTKNDFYKFEALYRALATSMSPADFFQRWAEQATTEQRDRLLRNISIANLGIGYALYHLFQGIISDENSLIENSWNYICGRRIPSAIKRKMALVGGVDKQNVEGYFLSLNRLIYRSGYSGWVIIVEAIENVALGRTEIIRNEAYNNIRQILDLQGSNQLRHTFVLFCSNNQNFIHQSIHNYKALAERIYPEIDLFQNFYDSRGVIWNI